MSYSYFDSSGASVEIPTSAILPFISISSYKTFYNPNPPSGYLYCDGYYYDSQDALYIPLFNLIGFNYGKVDFYVSADQPVQPYFRVPNLMGQDYPYTNNEDVVTPAPNAGGSFITVGGLNKTGVVNSTNTITLTTDQLPSHSHALPGQTDAPVISSQTVHGHTLTQGSISIKNSGGVHTHGMDDTTHKHEISGLNVTSFVNLNTSSPGDVPCFNNEFVTGQVQYNQTSVATGQGFEYASPKLSAASASANVKSTTSAADFTNVTDYAQYSGYAQIDESTTDQTTTYITGTENINVTNSPVPIPPTPSFIMNYLIKL